MRILLLATDVETRNYYITLAIFNALRRSAKVEAVRLANYGNAAALMIEERCDCFLAVGGAHHQPEILARLARLARVSILWTSEDPFEVAANIQYSGVFDHVFTNDIGSVAAYDGRARALPFAACPRFHDHPVVTRDADYRYDLLFVGTAWPNRVSTLNAVLSAIPHNLRVKIALPFNEHLVRPSLALPDCEISWRCSSADFARLANLSRITLTIERDFTSTEGGRGTAESPPPRLFETALAGGYQVVLSPYDTAADFYEPGHEIALCRNEVGVVHEIATALRDPAARIARAEAARRRTQREHLYDHRIAEIIRHTRIKPDSPRFRPRRRRNVLVVTHNLTGLRQGGGIEAYQEELPRMTGGFEFTFIVPTDNGDDSVYRVRRPDGSVLDHVLPAPVHAHALHDPDAEALFQRILVENDIDLVHFQHLIGFPLSLPLIADALGIPTVWTVHDYYLICKRFNLVDYTGKFCDVAGRSKVNCDICLGATDNLPAVSQGRRWNFLSEVVRRIDVFVISTPFSGNYLRRIYPEIGEEKIRLIEMLIPGVAGRAAPEPYHGSTAAPLRAVIPGNFTDGKGAHQLIRLMNLMRHRNIEFTILGYIHPDFAEILRALRIENLTEHGEYNAAEAVSLMSRFDVSLHLSIWPETYMITLSEAWAAGIVPIVSHLGAPSERMIDGVDGFVVDPHDVGGVIDLLEELAADRPRLQSMRANIAARPVPTAPRHLAELCALYEKLTERRPVQHTRRQERRPIAHHISIATLGIRTNGARWDSVENIWDRETSAGREGRISTFSDAVPGRVARLPQITLDGREPLDATIRLDLCRVDSAICPGSDLQGTRDLFVSGWAYAPYHGALHGSFLRLIGSDGATRVVAIARVARPDVGAALCDEQAGAAGFKASLNLSALPAGDYDLDLVQAYETCAVNYLNILHLNVRREVPPVIASIEAGVVTPVTVAPGAGKQIHDCRRTDRSAAPPVYARLEESPALRSAPVIQLSRKERSWPAS